MSVLSNIVTNVTLKIIALPAMPSITSVMAAARVAAKLFPIVMSVNKTDPHARSAMLGIILMTNLSAQNALQPSDRVLSAQIMLLVQSAKTPSMSIWTTNALCAQ